MTNPTLKQRLARRETWLQIAGMIGYFVVLGLHVAGILPKGPDEIEEILGTIAAYAHAIGLVGAGTWAQVRRGEQRARAAYIAGSSGGEGVSQSTVKALIAQHVATTPHPPKAEDTAPPPTSPPPAPPPPKNPLPAHVADMERRLQRLEHPFAPAEAAPSSPPASQPVPAAPSAAPAAAPPPNAV